MRHLNPIQGNVWDTKIPSWENFWDVKNPCQGKYWDI